MVRRTWSQLLASRPPISQKRISRIMLYCDRVRINEVKAALRELTATPLRSRVASGVLPPEVAKP